MVCLNCKKEFNNLLLKIESRKKTLKENGFKTDLAEANEKIIKCIINSEDNASLVRNLAVDANTLELKVNNLLESYKKKDEEIAQLTSKLKEEQSKNNSLNASLNKEDEKNVDDSSFSNDINNINNEINFSQNVDNLLDNLYSNGEKEAIAKINPKDFRALQQKVVETFRQISGINTILQDIYDQHYNKFYCDLKTWNPNTLTKVKKTMNVIKPMLESCQKAIKQMNLLALKLIPDRTQQNKYFNQIAKDNNQLKGTINNLRYKKARNQLLEQNNNIDMSFINYIK